MTRSLDFDEVLRAWLAEGVERAPVAYVDAALEQVERIPQRRQPLGLLRPMRVEGDRRHWAQPLMMAAAAALLFVVAAGIGIQTGLVKLPDPAQPGPPLIIDPSPDSAADLETFTADDMSFEIQLPRRWGTASGPDREAMYLANSPMELSIRAGDSTGQVRTCDRGAGPWETCETITETTLSELAAAIGLTQQSEAGVRPLGPTRTSTTLDGEPARVIKIQAYQSPASGSEFVTYVVAMHDGRPFILRAWTPRGDGIDILDLISGFRFLDTEEGIDSTPSPSTDPSSSVPESAYPTFTGPDRSLRIRLPPDWSLADGRDPSALYLWHEGSRIRLSIRGGDAEGHVQTCDVPAGSWESCQTVTVTTLDELADAVGLSPDADYWQGPLTSEKVLGGEPAISTGVVGKNPNPIAIKYVVAMHGGRPFVVRASQPAPTYGIREMATLLRGFTFLEPRSFVPDGMALELYSNPEHGYEIMLPSAWIDGVTADGTAAVPDSTAVAFRDSNAESGIALTITVGEPRATSLTALEGLLTSSSCSSYGELHRYRYLGGDPAGEERPERGNSCLGHPQSRYQVYAFHNRKPVVLAFDYWMIEFGRYAPRSQSWSFIQTIVNSFRFTDE